jgi:GTP cyclohydrolase-4
MKKQYKDPVNYKLTAADVNNEHYDEFLDQLTDVPSSVSLKPYSIDKAGISEQSAYISVKTIDDASRSTTMLLNIRMQAELVGHRGIHMSRCEEALFSLLDKTHDSLDAFTEALATKILELQESEKAYVNAEGIYVHQRNTRKSNKVSHDKMTLRASSIATKGKVVSTIGISAYNMTGCPCTETFTKFAIVPQLKDAGFDLEQITQILQITNSGTHTQRGLATVNVDKTTSNVTYQKLYEALDASCHLVYELLKRPDEHELVVRVLRNPQFTEDVIRDIVDNVIRVLGSEFKPTSRIFASSQLFDSIHIHDVYTEIEKQYSELVAENA